MTAGPARGGRLAATVAARTAVLRGRNFRRFYIGYVTSLLGTAMSAVAVAFAVLDDGGSPTDLGYVMAALILPQVLLVLGAGAVLGGLAALGRRPRRPLLVATLGTFGYPVPCLLLALRAGTGSVAAGAFAAGIGSALFNTFWITTLQQQVPAGRLSRASSFSTLGAFGPGTLGLVIAGPVAALAGAGRVLAAGAAWSVAGTLLVLSLPSIRAITWLDHGRGGVSPGRGGSGRRGR